LDRLAEAGLPRPRGFRRFWRDYLSVYEEIQFVLDEVIDAGDQIVVFLHQRAKGKASGARVEFLPYAQIATIKDGRIAVRFYSDREEALAVAGLTRRATPRGPCRVT
jgi:ketosteroid isomerase-like protein